MNGSQIAENGLRNGSENGPINIRAAYNNIVYDWCLTKSVNGSKPTPSYTGVTTMAKAIRKDYHDLSTLPVIAYYPVSRVIDNIKLGISESSFDFGIDVYKNALDVKPNFHSFFEWFRNQDDILNETALSRSHWMKQHKNGSNRN